MDGEASEDVHRIGDAAADALAGQRWRLMGARTQMEAHAYFAGTIRRELGLTFVIAMARHRLQREPFVGMSRRQRCVRCATHGGSRRGESGQRHCRISGCMTSSATRHQGDGERC